MSHWIRLDILTVKNCDFDAYKNGFVQRVQIFEYYHENAGCKAVNVKGDRYRWMVIEFLWPEWIKLFVSLVR